MSPEDSSSVLFRALPAHTPLPAPARSALRRFAGQLSETVAGGKSFTCLVSGDHLLQQLNKRFLGRDYPTDVLSFPAPAPGPVLGELAISIERAAVQAREFGHELTAEVQLLMLHGVLHLMGMNHEGDRGAMARAERRWRAYFGLPATLLARARA